MSHRRNIVNMAFLVFMCGQFTFKDYFKHARNCNVKMSDWRYEKRRMMFVGNYA